MRIKSVSYAYYTSIKRRIICVLYEYDMHVIQVLYAYHMQEYVKRYVIKMLDMKALHYAF